MKCCIYVLHNYSNNVVSNLTPIFYYLHIWGGEEAPINGADALLQRGLEDEDWLLLLVKPIHLKTARVPPYSDLIDAILGEVNG